MSKKSGKANGSRISAEHLKKIWGEIDVMDWLGILRGACPETNWVYQRQTIKGRCPFHDEVQPSFEVNLERKQAKCWGCGRYFWDPIRFYAEMNNRGGGGMTYAKAVTEMKDRFGLRCLPQKIVGELNKQQKHREMKKLLFELMQGELLDAAAMQQLPVQDPDLFSLFF